MSEMSSGTVPSGNVSSSSPVQRGLKAVVILLGALIVIAMGLVAVGIVLKMSHKGAAAHGPGTLTLAPGAKIESMQVDANRLILRLRTPAGEEIAIVDTTDGHLVGRVRTGPAAK